MRLSKEDGFTTRYYTLTLNVKIALHGEPQFILRLILSERETPREVNY